MDLHKARGLFLRVMKTLLFIEGGEGSELFNRTLVIKNKIYSLKILA